MKLPVIQIQDKEDMADNAALSNMCERPGGYATHRLGKASSYFVSKEKTIHKNKDAQTSRNNYI